MSHTHTPLAYHLLFLTSRGCKQLLLPCVSMDMRSACLRPCGSRVCVQILFPAAFVARRSCRFDPPKC